MRLRTVNLHDLGVAAFFRDNPGLVEWANQQPLANPLVCLGDGHDGVWNLFAQIGPTTFSLEILDWYHLIENLEKVGGSGQRVARVKALLWSGKVEEALKEFDDWDHPRVLQGLCYGRIVTALSTMAMIKPRGFPLVREMSNQRLSRYLHG